jgi:hypothetical protein
VTFVGIAIDVTAESTLLIDGAKRGKYLAHVRKTGRNSMFQPITIKPDS